MNAIKFIAYTSIAAAAYVYGVIAAFELLYDPATAAIVLGTAIALALAVAAAPLTSWLFQIGREAYADIIETRPTPPTRPRTRDTKLLIAIALLSASSARADVQDERCADLRTSMETAYGKAAACMRKMKTDSCAYAAWCYKTKPCVKASACLAPGTRCGKAHDVCFKTREPSACEVEKSACSACTSVREECQRCAPAALGCEVEALVDPKCKDVVGRYVLVREEWQRVCGVFL